MTAGPCCFDEQGSESLHSPEDREMVNLNASLGEQFLDVSVEQSVAQVPADSEEDHVWRKPESSERAGIDRSAALHQLTLLDVGPIRQRNDAVSGVRAIGAG